MTFATEMDDATTKTKTMSGWVHKAPPLNKRGPKVWHKRWLVLHADARLAYYRNDRSTKPIRVIDLCKCTRVDCGLEHKKYKYIFDVVLKSRTYFFSARDQTEMEEWVGAVCRLRSVASGETGDEFLPVRRPAARNRSPHHSNPSSPLPPAESDHVTQPPKTPTVTTATTTTTTTTTTSPISNRLRRIFSRNLFRKSRSDDAPTPTLPNKDLPPPPEVDRGLKPRPPTYRHLKPASPPTFSVSAPLQETNIFTFPSTTTTTAPAMMTSSTTMTSSAVATAPSASSDSAIDSLTQKSSDEHLSPLAWFPTKRTLATTTEDVVVATTAAQKPGSSSSAAGVGSSGSDSGAESEELDEPFMTAESRTYHYSVDEGEEEEEEEEEKDARGKNTGGELPHRAYFASSSYTGVRPSQGDENAVETEV